MSKTRNTNQKIKILEYLKSVKNHPTADMVYQKVRCDLPAISLATVYRNLNMLTENGNVCRIEVNGEYRYDSDNSFHQHCICKDCGCIIDIFQKEISIFAMEKIRTKEFKPNSVTIIFYGTCKKCKGVK